MMMVRLAVDVQIDRPVGEVRAFFADPDNVPRWDRGVVKVIRPTAGPVAVGAQFSTLGPAPPGRRGKLSVYRIMEVADDHATVALVDDPVFEKAHWTMRFTPTSTGKETDVRCHVTASARPQYFFIA